ncbi:MAG: homocysteine S-methyltransferase family protein [Clostridia bacterium]|nr:homocysteine S-methyltransferase family protein [Clostridia bacterium]
MSIKSLIGKQFILFDGAMGTMLQKNGMKIVGELPELLNITNPDVIENIHTQYIQAGSDVITTNTFGANSLKFKDSECNVTAIVTKAVEIAKRAAGNKYVALAIGPTGKIMEPTGDLKFDDAYELFKEQVVAGSKAGVDLILLETFSDLYEMKAGVLAAKENSDLPVFCSVTFQEDGRTLMGTDPLTMVNMLQDMGIDALGINCSLGPDQMIDILREIIQYSHIPVLVQPNAGLPKIVNGETVFEVDIQEFISAVSKMIELGIHIVGGCCGTTPNYISQLRRLISNKQPKEITAKPFTAVSTSTKTVMLDERIRIIGERINPTGKKKLKEALKEGNMAYIIDEAVRQAECGAHILDVNVGLPEIDEKEVMLDVIKQIEGIVNLPLQVDSTSPEVINHAVRYYNGKPIINSVNGKKEVMDAIFPIVKKYGTCVIALTLDEKGLPKTCNERVEIADRMIRYAETYGINKERIIVDCLTLTISAQQEAAGETLQAMKIIKEEYGVKTTLGASNISFGLPERKAINSTFLAAALAYGLDAPITDPTEKETIGVIKAFEALSGKDKESKDYIEYFSQQEKSNKDTSKEKELSQQKITLKEMVIKGLSDQAEAKTLEMIPQYGTLEIVNNHLIPALEIVGEKYEAGEIFLPQLIKSAETVKKSFHMIKEKMQKSGNQSIYYGKILIATVRGDIHDIGKNIAKVLLENYGYEVIDLGKDVPVEDIVKIAKEEKIRLVGLSALMTTTVKSMEDTIKALRKEGLSCKVMVGGAVLNEEYSKQIGADYYCKDGMAGVKAANEIFR